MGEQRLRLNLARFQLALARRHRHGFRDAQLCTNIVKQVIEPFPSGGNVNTRQFSDGEVEGGEVIVPIERMMWRAVEYLA